MRKLIIILSILANSSWLPQQAMAQTGAEQQGLEQEEKVLDNNDPFTKADKNKDGVLDVAEYKAYVDMRAAQGDRVSINIKVNQGYEGTFKAYDKNADKRLSRAEFIAATNIENS
ncbi:MAG: hypothetical protein ACWA5L_01720 [bacterium]